MKYLCYSFSILKVVYIVNYFLIHYCIDLYIVLCYIIDMNANTYTTPFIVKREGEIDQDLSILRPTVTMQDILKGSLLKGNLQAKMFVYDLLHHTAYRRTRNRLVQEQRNKEFETAIGLTRA